MTNDTTATTTTTAAQSRKVELLFIIDRSGSMGGLESDTIGGFNSTIAKQKETGCSIKVTTVLFDDGFQLLHDRVDIATIKDMTEKEYYVGGCTALLDAVGKTVKREKKIIKALPEGEKVDQVICVIITDGYENASREYSYADVKQLIEKRKEKGWEFLFLGANIDAAAEGERLGIRRNRSSNFRASSRGVKSSFDAIANATFCASCAMPIAEEWSDKIIKNEDDELL